jgi:outer membrane immunogenic protein
MTRISTILALAALGLTAGAAHAADPYGMGGSYQSQSYSAPQTFSWAGPYAGANLGYGWGDSSISDTDGFTGGLTGGLNWQQGPVVFGLEGDLGVSGIGNSGIVDEFNVDWIGTGRGRIGYAFDRFMLFGTGGFAWTRATYEFAGVEESNNHLGWSLGVGAEAAITDQLSAKIDYLHNSFDEKTYVNQRLDPTTNTLRVGLNYHF